MRRTTPILLAAAAAAALAGTALGAPSSAHADAATVVVDPGVRTPFGGWGTSLAWSANYTGGWGDRDQLADLLFGSGSGGPSLDLSIARYDIGGGNDPAYTASMRTGAAVPGYKPTEAGPYDWTADANQRWWLTAAQSRVPADRFVADAVSYSAPYWLTRSGQSTGNSDPAQDNLRAGGETEFAGYLADVVQHFHTDYGVDFRVLDPMNEPGTDYWRAGGKQEGMHVSPGANQAALLDATDDALRARGLTTGLAGADETGIDFSTSDLRALAGAGFDLGRLEQINTHTYSGGDGAQLRQLATGSNDARLQMSEITTSSGAHDHQSVDAALGLGKEIGYDLNTLGAEEWVYWQALESEKESMEGNGNWGLIHYASDGSQNYWITKKFHAMRQYSDFIRPGSSTLWNSGGDTTVSSLDPSTGKLTLVVRNDATTATPWTADLTRFASTGTAEVYRTSANEDRADVGTAPTSGRTLSTQLAPRSITTFVLPVNGGTSNPVQNPGFETGDAGQYLPGWKTWGGDTAGSHLDADYTQAGGTTAGGKEGVQWSDRAYRVYTWQTAQVPNGCYTLSAAVRSSGGQSTAELVAKHYGGPDLTAAIPAGTVYSRISIPNVCTTNGSVEIGFYSDSPANRWIAFDDVALT